MFKIIILKRERGKNTDAVLTFRLKDFRSLLAIFAASLLSSPVHGSLVLFTLIQGPTGNRQDE